MNLEGKNIVVVGLGVTGRAVARFAKSRGASVCVADSGDADALAEAAAEMNALGVKTQIGPHRSEIFTGADLIVVSPGVSENLAPLRTAAGSGVPVIGEIELACRFMTTPMVAVSGTNGKTTVTSLVGEMLRHSGRSVFVGGNIGDPLIGYIQRGQDAEIAVVEVSSFQLDTADRFHPKVAVMLNVAEDHLDRYPDSAAYAASKARLFRNQEPADTAVFNASDPVVRAMAESCAARRLFFGGQEALLKEAAGSALMTDETLVVRMGGAVAEEISLAGFRLRGRHNRENAAAAVLAALAAGADFDAVRTALDAFAGLPHRLQWVGTVKGVDFYDDSKATNVDAVKRALETFSSPVVLLLGGRDKDTDLSSLAGIAAGRVKRAVVMGEAAARLASVLSPVVPVTEAASMAEAVNAAFADSRPGEAVLLSPACASFDWYENYARRGEDFCRAVEAIERRESNG
ncbi:MAG: UDP-N-acetylmuramoyl-L-alanine--D-glutamate ligase [Desulfobacterales bacterium]|nr:UDP-N-acetylmuramoyl-L-alanine--D-glutamate ligase [Desulfobacterales bacterium]